MIGKYRDRAGIEELCKWACVAKSSFHYKPHPGPRGIKASTHTPWKGGTVQNEQVVEQIRTILGQDYCVYGYDKMTTEVRQALKDLEALQEFTHVATPEENAYIEAFHSIQQAELMDRHIFQSYYDAKQHIEKYMHWYNCHRRHGSLNGFTPMEKWVHGFACSPLRQRIEPGSGEWSLHYFIKTNQY